MRDGLLEIFEEVYRELCPQSAMPGLVIEFFAFANLKHTIRLRDGRLRVRLSDLLEGAPKAVLRALAHILLAKLYRKPIDRACLARYRKYTGSREIARKVHLVRRIRGRKQIRSAKGTTYDLDAIFEELNVSYFHGLLARPHLTWSQNHARNSLGHYDPAHNTIVVSRALDDPCVPRYALEYIVYHEMLHLRHPVRLRGSRRCVHSPEFAAEERLFPRLSDAKRFLKRL